MWAGLQAFPPEEACPPLVTSALLRLAEPFGLDEGASAPRRPEVTVEDTVLCPVCREPLRQEADRTWPGGCGHRLHYRCYTDLRRGRADTDFCPECQVGVDGLPRPRSCPHSVRYGFCNRGCGRRCVHNRWSGASPCQACHLRGTEDGGHGRGHTYPAHELQAPLRDDDPPVPAERTANRCCACGGADEGGNDGHEWMPALPHHEGMYCRHWIHWHCLDQARSDAAGQVGTGSPLCPGCWTLGLDPREPVGGRNPLGLGAQRVRHLPMARQRHTRRRAGPQQDRPRRRRTRRAVR